MSNKEIYRIDREHRANLKKICLNTLSFFHGLPLEWLDLYNSFLMEVPKIIEAYKDIEGGNFKGYLFSQCKYYTHNYCRSFMTNGHKMMNKSISHDDLRVTSLNDSVKLKQIIDTSVFSDVEMLIYKEHFLEEKTIKNVAADNSISFYKVKTLVKNIKVKLILQFKN